MKDVIAVDNDRLHVVEPRIIVKTADGITIEGAGEHSMPLKMDIAERPSAQGKLRFPRVAEPDCANAFTGKSWDEAFVGHVRLLLAVLIIKPGRDGRTDDGMRWRGNANRCLQQSKGTGWVHAVCDDLVETEISRLVPCTHGI